MANRAGRSSHRVLHRDEARRVPSDIGSPARTRRTSSRSSRRPSGSASTRSGRPRRTARTRRRCSPGSPPGRPRSSSARRSSRCRRARAAMTAMTAATIDQLSGGRMLLGIGSSGPQVAEGWHGQRFATPAAAHPRVRRGGAPGARPRARRVPRRDARAAAPDGPGKALKLMIAPVQERIPIYLAAIGPEEHGAGRRDRGRVDARPSSRPSTFDASAGCWPRARPGRGARWRVSRSRPPCQRSCQRRPRDGARHDAPVPGAIRRRHGLAPAELLQQPGRALRVRGRRPARSRACIWTARRTRPPRRCPTS